MSYMGMKEQLQDVESRAHGDALKFRIINLNMTLEYAGSVEVYIRADQLEECTRSCQADIETLSAILLSALACTAKSYE